MGTLPVSTQHLGPTQLGPRGTQKIPTPKVCSLDDHEQGLYLRTSQIKQICGLITYMKHIFGSYNSGIAPQDDPFHPFTSDVWSQQTPTQMRTYLIQNLPDPHGSAPISPRPTCSSRPTGYSTAAIELIKFKSIIKEK